MSNQITIEKAWLELLIELSRAIPADADMHAQVTYLKGFIESATAILETNKEVTN